jgi:hypothetical protein
MAKACAAAMPATAMIEPMDRSISPEQDDPGHAEGGDGDDRHLLQMFMKLLTGRKRGLSTEKTTQSTASEMRMPPYWRTTAN